MELVVEGGHSSDAREGEVVEGGQEVRCLSRDTRCGVVLCVDCYFTPAAFCPPAS